MQNCTSDHGEMGACSPGNLVAPVAGQGGAVQRDGEVVALWVKQRALLFVSWLPFRGQTRRKRQKRLSKQGKAWETAKKCASSAQHTQDTTLINAAGGEV